MYSFPLGEVAALSLPIPFAPIFCGIPSRRAVWAISTKHDKAGIRLVKDRIIQASWWFEEFWYFNQNRVNLPCFDSLG